MKWKSHVFFPHSHAADVVAVYFISFYIQSIHCHNNFPKEIPFFHKRRRREIEMQMQNNVTFCPAHNSQQMLLILLVYCIEIYKHLLYTVVAIIVVVVAAFYINSLYSHEGYLFRKNCNVDSLLFMNVLP